MAKLSIWRLVYLLAHFVDCASSADCNGHYQRGLHRPDSSDPLLSPLSLSLSLCPLFVVFNVLFGVSLSLSLSFSRLCVCVCGCVSVCLFLPPPPTSHIKGGKYFFKKSPKNNTAMTALPELAAFNLPNLWVDATT